MTPVRPNLPDRPSARIAVIGDRFMLPGVFVEKITAACGDGVDIHALEQNWPDEPMRASGLDGLREFYGEPVEIVHFIGDAEIFVTHLAPLTGTMMEACPGLKLVAVSRGGPVNIDMDAARRHGIKVVNVPGRNASAVAEFTLGAILAETRKITAGHAALARGEWRGDLYRADIMGRELNELSVGVVGYGAVGTRVVRLLRAFGARILVADPYVQLSAEDRAAGVEHVGLDTLLKRADVVTLHARVTPETTGFIGAEQFARMRPGTVFVNTARGPLVDHAALYEALASGHLGGAALDTFAIEPVPPNEPLLRLSNVTLSPHMAGASLRTVTFAAEQVAEEVRRFLEGEPPRNLC